MNIMKILETMDYGVAPENTDAALAWLNDHNKKFGLFIDGKFIHNNKAKYFYTYNPATGEKLAQITQANSQDVDTAVKAANIAQKSWVQLSGFQRAKYLYAIARLVQKHARLFAVLESLDNGKPIRESRDVDIPLVIRHFYYHAGWAQLLEDKLADYEAIGVAGQIIPWNFPLLMLAWKIAPALAAGNTVVLKPAEYTSLSALLFAEICVQAGLPKGVVNIVTGDGKTGACIVNHQDVHKIAFTGSTAVGRLIRQQTAGTGKKLTLELGGKSAFIVFDDADIDSAIEGIVDAIWFNQGQVCCAGSRLLVQESIADRFHQKLKARMAKLRIGDPLDKSIDIGAIIDESQRKRITELVKLGVAEGAELFQAETTLPKVGCFYPATLLTEVDTAHFVAQEEIFGPVLVSLTFRTPSEAVALANNVRYGLACSIWSENINLAMDIAPKVIAGIVWINCTNQFDAAAGFGGKKESGFGREGGIEGMYAYLKPTYEKNLKPVKAQQVFELKSPNSNAVVDRTPKFYIAGKQVRPDGGYSQAVISAKGQLLAHVGKGNRKDIRNAVEAAAKAVAWTNTTAHNRAQVLYFIAENLSLRSNEFASNIQALTGATATNAKKEVDACVQRLFYYAAYADKLDGAVHAVPLRGVVLAMPEAVGTMGIICPDENPLLGFISLMAATIAMGNRIVIIPSQTASLTALEFYQILQTSDVPAGVVNIITGNKNELAQVLADHYEVESIWYFGDKNGSEMVEKASAANLKRTWVNNGKARDWFNNNQAQGKEFLNHATDIKNIWTPYGE
ncbi:Aldehyde dehydrogenase [hydrothermal vent metagenome]|uniref:Aldehyde dehydrogenase n=1 Tax=hydrothermal vent metagenome TaxID=652676 RepID=A0A3B0W1S0_9ZZZZ